MKKYHIKIEDRSFDIEVDEFGKFRIEGKEIEFELHASGKTDAVAKLANRNYEVMLDNSCPDKSECVVYVNGRGIPLTIEDEKTALLKQFEGSEPAGSQSNSIKSPMPGKINKILVQEGDEIQAGQGVLILEAMKMENEIKSPSSGIIARVHIKETDAVEKNELLIEIS